MLGGTPSCGWGINAAGQIAGTSYTVGDKNYHAFLYSEGAMIDLGALSVPDPVSEVNSSGLAINDRGQVTGDGATGAPNGYSAFLYSDGKLTNLGPPSGIPPTFGLGINEQGYVVGHFGLGLEAGNYHAHAALFSNGGIVDLGTLGGTSSRARGINARGQVTGESQIAGNITEHAFLWSDGVMTDIGALAPGVHSMGYAINARGHIVGDVGDIRRAFLYANGAMVDLGSMLGGREILWSVASGLNNLDDVVGQALTTDDTPFPGSGPRAFLYTKGTMYDLNDLVVSDLDGKRLGHATGINDRGQIAANSNPSGFLIHCTAYRLDPVLLAVEYRNADFGHYFVTAEAREIETLDAGAFTGWTRTGETFLTYPLGTPGTDNVCRFWSGQTFAPRSSHFYASFGWECEQLKSDRDWVFEGEVFAVNAPLVFGACRTEELPLYRLYNNGRTGAPNHRYTTSMAIRDAMIAQGWSPEGYGTLGVVGCVPQP